MGNGYSGSSLLIAVLNAHSKIEADFEYFDWKQPEVAKWYQKWQDKKTEATKIWGNKIPLELLAWGDWKDEDILPLIDDYYIIWNTRKFENYRSSFRRRQPKGKENIAEYYTRSKNIYAKMLELRPNKIIHNNFEDFVTDPEKALTRICNFLDIDYEPEMQAGSHQIRGGYKGQAIDSKKAA